MSDLGPPVIPQQPQQPPMPQQPVVPAVPFAPPTSPGTGAVPVPGMQPVVGAPPSAAGGTTISGAALSPVGPAPANAVATPAGGTVAPGAPPSGQSSIATPSAATGAPANATASTVPAAPSSVGTAPSTIGLNAGAPGSPGGPAPGAPPFAVPGVIGASPSSVGGLSIAATPAGPPNVAPGSVASGVNAPAPEEEAAKQSLSGEGAISRAAPAVGPATNAPTPEEVAAGASLTGARAVSAEGGQSLQANAPAAQGQLTAQSVDGTPDFQKIMTDGWTSAKNLVDQHPGTYKSLGEAFKTAEAAGKSAGDWLDNTDASKMVAYQDANGKTAGFSYTANMANDTDGQVTALSGSDKSHQSTTTLQWQKDGKNVSLDPSQIPYVAIPPELVQASGAKPGDLVRIKDGEQVNYGVFGDGGVPLKAGEASMKVHDLFGRGLSGSVDDKARNQRIEYTIMTGSGARNSLGQGAPWRSSEDIQTLGAAEYARFIGRLR